MRNKPLFVRTGWLFQLSLYDDPGNYLLKVGTAIKDFDEITSFAFCLIHGGIGIIQQGLFVLPVVWKEGYADAACNVDCMALNIKRLKNRLFDLFAYTKSIRQFENLWQQD